MQSLIENWFFLLVALGCLAMHLFGHGHGPAHEHRHPSQDEADPGRLDPGAAGRERH
jgi:hypothetical protein